MVLEVTVGGLTAGGGGGPCRAWIEIMNRNDGLFTVRYKLFLPCERVTITVRAEGRLLAERSTKTVTSWPDSCNCPLASLQVGAWPNWLVD